MNVDIGYMIYLVDYIVCDEYVCLFVFYATENLCSITVLLWYPNCTPMNFLSDDNILRRPNNAHTKTTTYLAGASARAPSYRWEPETTTSCYSLCSCFFVKRCALKKDAEIGQASLLENSFLIKNIHIHSLLKQMNGTHEA